MGVLFVMPTWFAHSELWMQRMLQELEPELVGVAADSPTQDTWMGTIPSIALRDPSLPTVWTRVGRHLSARLRSQGRAYGRKALLSAMQDPRVTVILVHYIEFALEFQDVWDDTKTPLFVHCHGYDVTWDLRYFERPGKRRFPSDYADRVRHLASRAIFIANSQATKQRLLDIDVPPDRIRVKYMGVPTPDSPPYRSPCTHGLRILYLGRLVDFKGPDLVIRAFEYACERGLDAHLTMAGDGPMRGQCERLVRRSAFAGRMEMLGWVDDAEGNDLRRCADIFTAHNCHGPWTRQEEAFGVAVVEAMSAALPVVSGRNGSLPETVADGETGILVDPGDIAAHAQALLRLAVDPTRRRRMGEAGWRRARERFSVDAERDALWRILGLPSRNSTP